MLLVFKAYSLGIGDCRDHYLLVSGRPIVEEGATEKAHSGNDVYYLKGKRYVVPSGTDPDWPYELSTEERKLGLRGLWSKYVAPIVARVGDSSSPGWPGADASELDSDTLNDLLRKRGATDAVISVLRMTFLGEDYDHVSALQDLVWQPFIERNKKWMHLRDGNDQLPRAFAQRLGDRIHYGCSSEGDARRKDGSYIDIQGRTS